MYISGVTASPAPQITYIMKTRTESTGHENKAKKARSLTHLLGDERLGPQSRQDIGDIAWFDVYERGKAFEKNNKRTETTYASPRPDVVHRLPEREDHSCNLQAARERIPSPLPNWRATYGRRS